MVYEAWIGVVNMSVTAGLVIVCVLLARLALKRAPKVFSYVLWAAVLFRLLCPVSVGAGFSLLGLTGTPVRESAGYTTRVEYVQPAPLPAAGTGTQAPAGPGGQTAAAPSGEAEGIQPSVSARLSAGEIAARVWLAGVLAMAGWGVGSYLRVRRRVVGAVRLEGNLYLADHIPTPFVMGVFRPRIYLPAGLGPEEQEYVVRHERCHIRALDPAFRLLAFAALCIHWFNPLVWLAFFLSGKDMEMRCDEAVVRQLGEGSRADYSACLLALAAGRRMLAGAPLAFGEGDTRGRIQNLARWRRPRRWAALLAAVVCIAVVGACAANPGGEESPPPEQTVSTQPPAETQSPEGGGGEASPGVQALADSLAGVETGETPLNLTLTQDGEELGPYEQCWTASNSVYYWNQLLHITWRAAEEPDVAAGERAVKISELNGWNLTAYGDRSEVCFHGPTGSWWLAPEEENAYESPYQLLRGWLDELEYAQLGGGYDRQTLVIPDKGQGYLEAAAAYVQAFEGLHLQAAPGSKYCYSYVSTQVEAAEDTTAAMREQGEIGENTYCFYLTTVFVPENEMAFNYSMAGNTGEHTGGDPNAPENAMEYYRCGYITLEADGWHAELVGTGW